MPAGTNTSPNDALTAAKFAASIDKHLLMSSLQRLGISFDSAEKFSQGQEVTNAEDRLALAGMLSELLKQSTTLR
jgi:hypothetical protein